MHIYYSISKQQQIQKNSFVIENSSFLQKSSVNKRELVKVEPAEKQTLQAS